jgi:hypothetical protein
MKKSVKPSQAAFPFALAVLFGVVGWMLWPSEACGQMATVDSGCDESYGRTGLTDDGCRKAGSQTIAFGIGYNELRGQISSHDTVPDNKPAWRWAQDSFLDPKMVIQHDKLQHFAASAVLYMGLRLLGGGEGQSVIAIGSACVLWEVKDGIVPWETYGFWGGDGFSWRDVVADAVGITAAILIWRIDTGRSGTQSH